MIPRLSLPSVDALTPRGRDSGTLLVGLAVPGGIEGPELVRLARGAEQLGLDSVWLVDRRDPIEVLADVAMRTSRLLLGTSAIQVLDHVPVLLARRLATLDELARGRLRVSLTIPRSENGFEDRLANLREVWGPDEIALHVGHKTFAGLKCAARIGDGLYLCRNDIRQLAVELELWHELVAAAGRDPRAMPVVLRAAAAVGRTPSRTLFRGDAAGWTDRLARLLEMGVGHVVVEFDAASTPDAILGAAARLDLDAARAV